MKKKAGTVPPDEDEIGVNFPGIQSSNRGNRGRGHWVSFGKNKAVSFFLTRVELTDACKSCLFFCSFVSNVLVRHFDRSNLEASAASNIVWARPMFSTKSEAARDADMIQP